MRRLDGAVAMITGGASGLGKAIAERLASEGAIAVITDIQATMGASTASECGFTFFEQDVCDEVQWPRIIQEIEDRFGRLDVLVNNAGVLGATDRVNPENTRLADWRRVFAVNVEGTFLGCRSAIPAMRRAGSGSIINISSVAGLSATPYATAYGASKAAVRQLTKSVAQYCAQQGLSIRCNSVHPGNVRTPLLEKYVADVSRARGVAAEDVLASMRAAIPMGDFSHPEDVAAAVSFLVSPDSARMTGTMLLVDGGSMDCDTFRQVGPTNRD